MVPSVCQLRVAVGSPRSGVLILGALALKILLLTILAWLPTAWARPFGSGSDFLVQVLWLTLTPGTPPL